VTSIDRSRFLQDVCTARISIDDPPPAVRDVLAQAGVQKADLEAIAGKDRVIYGADECAKLYDTLVAAEQKQKDRATPIDYASLMYRAVRGGDAPLTTLDGAGSSRARPVGIMSATKASEITKSEYVRTYGGMAAASLDDAARRNVLGPEAKAQRSIRAMTDSTSARMAELESKSQSLAAGSKERQAMDAQIDAETRTFENAVRAELADARRSRTQSTPLQSMEKGLPPYVRDSIRREGLVIPGAPGAVEPKFGKTPGVVWKIKF
jgi:hypothetical protein